MDAFGIDFGTTNSVLARATGSSVESVLLDDELPVEWIGVGFDQVLPSVIGFADGRPTFGWRAKQQRTDRLEAVKRLFATSDTVAIGGRVLKVEEAAAIFFRHLQGRVAKAGIASRLDRAVVTIPANSRGKSRYRTKLSAGLAGIEVMALINEPTAAAMAHARTIGQDQRILVFDWGGGTLDVTVLQSFEGALIEQSSKGIQRLGGLDVDDAFLDVVLRRIPAASRWGEAERNTFRLDLELGKIQLSSRTAAQVPVPGGGFVDVVRGELEEAIAPLIELTRDPVEVCLRESPGRIDHLVMVGGSSKMPVIERFIADLVGTPVSAGVDPMTAVAQGAAVAAGILQGTITDLEFYVGTEHALGTITHDGGPGSVGEFSVLIGRNTKYPASATRAYTPAVDFQKAVAIEVIEGDPEQPIDHDDNVVLKDWSVELPEGRTVAEAVFDVTFTYDVDGILQVLVRDRGTAEVLMEEELAFGASEDRSQLPVMRRQVDGLMAGHAPSPAGSPPLAPEAVVAIHKARTKVIPFVPLADRTVLEKLVNDVEAAGGGEPESEARLALEAALRNHSYLL